MLGSIIHHQLLGWSARPKLRLNPKSEMEKIKMRQFAANLSPPIAWVPVYTNANGRKWQFTETNTMANTSRFYRISTP